MSERDELLAGIQAALKGSSGPAAPQVPGIPADAPQHVRDAAVASIMSRPGNLLTQDEAAYLQAVKDQRVHGILAKDNSLVTADERAELVREIRACQERGWQ